MELTELLIFGNMVFSFLLFVLLCFVMGKNYILDTVVKSLLKQKAMEGMKMPVMVNPDGTVVQPQSNNEEQPNYMG